MTTESVTLNVESEWRLRQVREQIMPASGGMSRPGRRSKCPDLGVSLVWATSKSQEGWRGDSRGKLGGDEAEGNPEGADHVGPYRPLGWFSLFPRVGWEPLEAFEQRRDMIWFRSWVFLSLMALLIALDKILSTLLLCYNMYYIYA